MLKYIIPYINIVREKFGSFTQRVKGFRPKQSYTMNFVENEFENQALTYHAAIIVGPDDKRTKKKQFNSKKNVFNSIRGDQFQNIFLFDMVTSLILVLTMLFSLNSDHFPSRCSFSFIISSYILFTLHMSTRLLVLFLVPLAPS